MDASILAAEERLAYISGDEDAMDMYRRRFMAACDHTSALNNAHRQGRAEGRQEIRELLDHVSSLEQLEELKQKLSEHN